MLKNFLKVSIRNLVRNKTYSFINILGLSIGLACSILIFLFIIDELSYDRYHEKADQIYRVGIEANLNGTEMKAFATGAPVANILKNEIPEVINSTRLVHVSFDEPEAIVEYDNQKFIEDGMFFVDSTFADIFDVKFIDGNPNKCLNESFKILITKTLANKYYGNENPVGKNLTINGNEYLIEGLIEDCPENSHFHYTILASIISSEVADYTTWMSSDFSYTYLLLAPEINTDNIITKMNEIGLRHITPELEQGFGVTIEDFLGSGNTFNYVLQPITDIHLKSHTNFEIEPNSNIIYVYIFLIVACFILFIAIINFMNLSTARSATRAKEVGIRKTVGAHRKSLFYQFLFESVVMSLISLIVGMVLLESVLPIFNSYTLKNISLNYFSNVFVLPSLIILAIIVGVISGLYSAGYLSSAKTLDVIKGKLLSGKTQSWFRSFLVTFQFSISIALFICTIVIYNQVQLLKNKDVGFNKQDIIVLEKAQDVIGSFDSFRSELESNPLIESVTYSNTLPARTFGGFPLRVEGDESNKTYVPRMMSVDFSFNEIYDFEMIEGRFFSEDFSTDTFGMVLNEAAVKEFGFKKPYVGKRLITTFYDEEYNWEVIGVVKDFNYRSLHQKVDPLIIASPFVNTPNLISIKLKTGITKECIDFIKEKWQVFSVDTPIDYYVMEDDYNNMHKEEFKTGQLFYVFSILAIFIACLGLFGLASFLAEQKTKEVGIRKAMGASTMNIVKILLIQFTKWVLWANIIAWPVSYLFLRSWLQNFAYNVDLKWYVFIAGSILGLLIAIITVSYQAMKAASRNPVNSLRYE